MVQLNVYRMGERWLPFTLQGQEAGNRAILEWVRVGASESPEVPSVAQLEPSIFGDAIALRGAEIVPEEQDLRVTLWWEALEPLDRDYTVFVHLVGEDGQLAGTGDSPPLEGGFPTRLWRPGDGVADEHIVPIPPDLPTGVYTVQVGWYDPPTGVRLLAVRGGERLWQDAVTVGTWARP
jgi:hypothetical protein